MRVKLLTWRCGQNYSQKPGAVVDLPDDEAARLIAAGSAEPLGIECAAVAPQHTAALTLPRKRRQTV